MNVQTPKTKPPTNSDAPIMMSAVLVGVGVGDGAFANAVDTPLRSILGVMSDCGPGIFGKFKIDCVGAGGI